MVHPSYTASGLSPLMSVGCLHQLWGRELPPELFWNKRRVYENLKALTDGGGYAQAVQGMDWHYLNIFATIAAHAIAAVYFDDPDAAAMERLGLEHAELPSARKWRTDVRPGPRPASTRPARPHDHARSLNLGRRWPVPPPSPPWTRPIAFPHPRNGIASLGRAPLSPRGICTPQTPARTNLICLAQLHHGPAPHTRGHLHHRPVFRHMARHTRRTKPPRQPPSQNRARSRIRRQLCRRPRHRPLPGIPAAARTLCQPARRPHLIL